MKSINLTLIFFLFFIGNLSVHAIDTTSVASPVLMHSYTFENDGSATDIVGNLNGTLNGSVVVTDGKATIDPAANGVGQDYGYISFNGDSLALNTYSALTVESYVIAGDGTNDFFTMLYYFGDDIVNYLFCQMTEGNWNANVKTTANEGELGAWYGSIIDDGLKHHVVAVLTSTSLEYYVDGVLHGSATGTGLISSIGTQFANLFRGPNGWNDDNWIGSIEEFNIYEGAMSSEMVSEHATSYLGGVNDARLASLVISDGDLIPAFNSDIFEYSVEIPDGITQIEVTGNAVDANAVVDDGFVDVSSGLKIDTVTVTLNGTTNHYLIKFYANNYGLQLKHSYTFNDGTADDNIGNANGTLVGNGYLTNGAYTAETNGDYIELPAGEININTYNGITLEAFIHADVDNTPATMMAYFGGNENGFGGNGYYLTPDRWDESRTGISCGNIIEPWNAEQGVTGSPVSVGEFHHVVSILTHSDISLYIDGILVGTEPLNANNSIDLLSNANAWLCKGGYDNDPTWIGTIDEFNIYEGVMDVTMIAQRAEDYNPVNDVVMVAYVNDGTKMMAQTAAQVNNDPIMKMLGMDPNIMLNVFLVSPDDTDTLDLSMYDVVIAQEGFASASEIFKPGRTLGLGNIPVPFIYNKVYAMRDGRAFTNGASGSGGRVDETLFLRRNQDSELFNGITFAGDSVQIFDTTANDDGSEGGIKGLQLATDVVISEPNTLFASGVNDPANATVCVNDIPAGATIGSETLQARMIALGQNYGAICKDGKNLTQAGLTLWRNAVYSLAGLEVPTTPVDDYIEPIVLPYEENFETDLGDFSTFSELGDQVWEWTQQYGAKISGYESGSHENKDYLISPTFDLTNYYNVFFEFSEAVNYQSDFRDHLHILVSTNYQGDVLTADFDTLQIQNRGTGNNWDFVTSEAIDLSMYAGMPSVTILFSYESTIESSSTWEINHFRLSLNMPIPEAILTHSYDFETSDSTYILDAVGNVDGMLKGSNIFVAGGAVTVSNAYSNTDGYIEFDAAAMALNTYDAITLEAFVQSAEMQNTNAYTMLAYFGNNLGGDRCFWIQPTRGNNEEQTRIETNNGTSTITAAIDGFEIDDNMPHHLVAILTPDLLKYYVDGKMMAETPTNGENYISTIDTEIAQLFKGPDNWADPNYNASLEEFNIYNGELSPQLIHEHAMNFTGIADDARLSWLEVSDGHLVPDFDPDIHSYIVEIPEGVTAIDVTAYPISDSAMVDDGMVDVSPGNVVRIITVTLPNGITNDYVINFNQPNYNITLQHSYTFENGTADDVINGANGTVYGGEIINGKYSTHYQGDYIELPAAEIAINNYSQITLEAFIKTEDNANPGYSMLSYFGDTDSTGMGIYGYFMQMTRDDNQSKTAISCASVDPYLYESSGWGPEIDDGQIHHVVSVITQFEIKWYIDGMLTGIEMLSDINSIDKISTSFAYLAKSGYDGDPTWIGAIDEFNIYEGEMDPMLISERAKQYYGSNTAHVAYLNDGTKVMAPTATPVDNDPIIQMLGMDPNIMLDVLLVSPDTTTTLDLSMYDVVIAQEGFASASEIFKPGKTLGLGNIPVPFIYNKVYAMRDDRAFTNGASGSGGRVDGTLFLHRNQDSELFNGITFDDGNSVQIFHTTANDDGSAGGIKGLQLATDVVISEPNTLFASGINDPANATICVNDIPAGATIGSETLQARMIALGQNYGAICKDGGNLTQAGLTLWRNAVYSLAGLEVPTTPVEIHKPYVTPFPIDFEDDISKYTLWDYSGTYSEIIDNPYSDSINGSNRVVKTVKSAGEAWAGTVIPTRQPIDLSQGKTFKMKVWSPRYDVPVSFTLENFDDYSISFSDIQYTTTTGAWEELTFHLDGIDEYYNYEKINIKFDEYMMGDGSYDYTFYFDDIRQINTDLHPDEIIFWNGIDVDDDSGNFDYPSQVTSELIDNNVYISGLGIEWMTSFNQEEIIDQRKVALEFNDNSDTIVIPDQLYLTTLHDSIENNYSIAGYIVVNEDNNTTKLKVEYELYNIEDDYYCAATLFNDGTLTTPTFVANLWHEFDEGIYLPYAESFEYDLGDFSTYSEYGDQQWQWTQYGATMSGYESGSFANKDFLISPTFDFTNHYDVVMEFSEAVNYQENFRDYLHILVSTDYNGDISTATFDTLNVVNRATGSNWDFIQTERIDLSNYAGFPEVTIFFLYESTSESSSTWEINHFSIYESWYHSKDYSEVQLGLIGTAYYYGNNTANNLASWDECWTNESNSIVPAAPDYDANSQTYTWTFDNVIMNGVDDNYSGMFKFADCMDNKPLWNEFNFGYNEVDEITGTGISFLNYSDWSAFTANTNGEDIIFDIKFIIDQSNESDHKIVVFNLDENTDYDPVFYVDNNGVTIKCDYCVPGDTGTVNGILYEAVDRALLDQKISDGADLSTLNTTLVHDMSYALHHQIVEDDITTWDVSNVIRMSHMFDSAQFNQELSYWDVSKVNNMEYMFFSSTFDGDVSTWDVSRVWNMSHMFWGSPFNREVGNWNVSNVNNFHGLFTYTNFNQDVSTWDVSNVQTMYAMFAHTPFNQDISNWSVVNVWNMDYMFRSTPFNQDISKWDVGSVNTMYQMFYLSAFNQDISSWNVHNVWNMAMMFGSSSFNQPIGDWNMSNVEIMDGMFFDSPFNQDISGWNIHNVYSMEWMFERSAFNQPIGNWDVGSVETMHGMFSHNIVFDQYIGDWNVSNVHNMEEMFDSTNFNQDISGWCVWNIPEEPYNFAQNALLEDQFKPVWGSCSNDPTSHFQVVWEGNGVDQMNINVFAARIEGINLDFGDEIGVFDGDICVGRGIVDYTISDNNLLSIIVSANDGSGNGYTTGNPITYRFFDSSTDTEYRHVNAMYSNQNPDWSTDGLFKVGATAFVELDASHTVTQTIDLIAGWNIFSLNIIPNNPDFMNFVQPLIDNEDLKKVMDEAGNSIEDFGMFGGWMNNIGNLHPTEGYKINVLENITLAVEGERIMLPFTIDLISGWNIISWPSDMEQDGLDAVQALIDNGYLVKVMNESGQSIEDYGMFGGWQNNIGNFMMGEGYKVKVNSDCSITINYNYDKSASVINESSSPGYFNPIYSGNGTNHMNINILNLDKQNLSVGDEIGIFDGENCVGAAKISQVNMDFNNAQIVVSGNDNITTNINGFIEGNNIKAYVYKNGELFNATINSVYNRNTVFTKNESLFGTLAFDMTNNIAIKDVFGSEVQCYPNPFSAVINIAYYSPSSKDVDISIYNLNGQRVKTIYDGQITGSASFVWDGTNDSKQKVPFGIYTVKANENITKIIFK